jgi:hypothetical protein
MPNQSLPIHRTKPLEEWTRDELRTERHTLGNEIQSLYGRLDLLDLELARRERERGTASPLFPAAGAVSASHAPVLEVVS